MADPTCHYCDRLAEAECATCGRLYCPEHGADVCLRCLAPDSAAPSALAYRGSLVALGLATAVAAFLIIRPPQSASTVDEPRPVVTNTPAFQQTATPTALGGGGATTPTSSRPTTTIATSTPTTEATVEPTQGSGGGTSYTILPGDSLSQIAADHGVTAEAILEANPDIGDPLSIQPGQVIMIPAS